MYEEYFYFVPPVRAAQRLVRKTETKERGSFVCLFYGYDYSTHSGGIQTFS